MKKSDITKIGVLLDWKLSTDFDLSKLKDLKEETTTDDVAVFAKRVFEVLRLEDIFEKLGLEIPDFDAIEDDEEDKDINEQESLNIYKKSFYKWL